MTMPWPTRPPRLHDRIYDRVLRLVSRFDSYVEIHDARAPSARSARLSHHREAIMRRRASGSAVRALDDDAFLAALYAAVHGGGGAATAAGLVTPAELAAALGRHRDAIAALEELRIDDRSLDPQDLARRLWPLVDGLDLAAGLRRVVVATKTLHHMLPDLVPPMDRTWTGLFFGWQAADLQARPEVTFLLAYHQLAAVAQAVQPARLVGEGWRTSRTKVLDNALIGYCKAEGLAP